MAEGRMLKRNISESRRLAALKTDSARLLWTWIIPFLDSEGRFYASADMIRGKVVPRLPTFTEKNIPEYIDDMAAVGLITLYRVDGELLLQYRKFDTFQKIVKTREAAPLSGPEKGELVPIGSGSDQDRVESESRLPCCNLREVKLREQNAREEHLPVDNSKTEMEKPAPLKKEEKPKTVIPQAMENGNGSMEKFTAALQSTLSEIYQTYPDFKIHRQVQLFLELNLKSGHRGAIIQTLRSILYAKKIAIDVKNVGAYLSTVFKIEHAKFNARDHEREAEQWKLPLTPAAREMLDQLGLGGFGGGG